MPEIDKNFEVPPSADQLQTQNKPRKSASSWSGKKIVLFTASMFVGIGEVYLIGKLIQKVGIAIGRYFLAFAVFSGGTLIGRIVYRKLLATKTPLTDLRKLRRALNDSNPNAKRVTLKTSDHVRLDGMYFPVRSDILHNGPTAILCQGNFTCYEEGEDLIHEYQSHNINVMVFNYRGYGESQHAFTRPSADGALRDAEAAISYVRKQSKGDNNKNEVIANNKIVIHGMSIGGGVAVRLAAQKGNEGVHLIADQTFAKLEDVGADMVRNRKTGKEGPMSKIARVAMRGLYGFDSEETIKEVTGEVCVIRAEWDTMMDEEECSHAKRLYDARYPEGAKDEEGNDRSDLHRIAQPGEHLGINYSETFDKLQSFLYNTILKQN